MLLQKNFAALKAAYELGAEWAEKNNVELQVAAMAA